MAELGVRRLFAKRLSPNDNSKNQVYLGGDLGVVNVLPAQSPRATTSGSFAKPIFTARMSLSWIDDEGGVHDAPGSQLILYPQYPEVRLSGFLKGASWAPSDIMRSRAIGRVMLFGIGPDNRVFCYAATADHPVTRALDALRDLELQGVLLQIPIRGESADSRGRLLAELCRISRLGWIPPWRLRKDGSRDECRGPNCVGVTLESELGILANGRSDPDYDGWEVKAHSVTNLARPYSGVLTLLTPEPNGGFYASAGVEAFVRRYGYADLKGREDRLNFGGIHRVGNVAPRTGLRLALTGFDVASGKLLDARGALSMLDATDNVAASWSYEGLLAHWTRKHARAAYVPAVKSEGDAVAYRYGSRISCAEGTDYSRLLAELASGRVFLDPGIKVEGASSNPKVKRRNQFRVKFSNLGFLYHNTYEIDACEN